MTNPKSAVTLVEVAAEAGVSLATASRALNGSARQVRADLAARVLAAAERLDYAVNAQAQAMAKGTSNVVGLLVSDISDPYFSAIAAGVAQAAEEQGLLVMLGSTMGRPDREIQYLNALRGQRGRAAILAGSRVDDRARTEALAREVAAFERSGGKVVAISQARLPADTVVIENRSAAKALATALAALGHRRFGVLAGPAALLTARDRDRGFREGVEAAGLLEPAAVHGTFTRDGGFEAMNLLLDASPRVECVFAVNDVMAVGAMAACRERGLAIPGDVAVAGFDDIETLRDVHPPLTTVRLPLHQIGLTAMQLVLSASDSGPRRRRVRGEVVLRESTARGV